MSAGILFFFHKFLKLTQAFKSIWWQWSRWWGSKFAIIAIMFMGPTTMWTFLDDSLEGLMTSATFDAFGCGGCNWNLIQNWETLVSFFFFFFFLSAERENDAKKIRRKDRDHPPTQPPAWWPHPPRIRPWAPSFFSFNTIYRCQSHFSLLHYFPFFLFLLLEHLKGLNFLSQLGRAGYDSISNREKDLVRADLICELGCM